MMWEYLFINNFVWQYNPSTNQEHKRAPTQLTRKHMDVNDDEGQRFYCFSTFQSQSRIFNNDHYSYPDMSVKQNIA